MSKNHGDKPTLTLKNCANVAVSEDISGYVVERNRTALGHLAGFISSYLHQFGNGTFDSDATQCHPNYLLEIELRREQLTLQALEAFSKKRAEFRVLEDEEVARLHASHLERSCLFLEALHKQMDCYQPSQSVLEP